MDKTILAICEYGISNQEEGTKITFQFSSFTPNKKKKSYKLMHMNLAF